MHEPRARRSELATPASSEKMCAKAPSSGADLVFLDLEDACAPRAKEGARQIAVDALTGQDWGRTVRAVRVNGLDLPPIVGRGSFPTRLSPRFSSQDRSGRPSR